MTSNKKDGVTLLLEKQKTVKKLNKIRKRNRRIVLFSTIVFLVTFSYFYYYSRFSRINYITVTGNDFLSRNDVLTLAGTDENSLYLLTFNSVLEHRIAENPLIQSVTVTKQSGRNVLIRIQEKRIIGYTYLDQAYLVLADNTLVELAADKQAVIAELPLLVDFDNSEIAAGIGSALDKLSLEVLRNISEIHRYSTSYDENMLKIVMIDGNQIYTSLNAIDTVNNYFSILEVLKVSNSCIFIEDSSKTAYSSSCPAAATADAAAEN